VYLKTNGEWVPWGDPEPPAAEVFATTLVMIDRDTQMIRAIAMPTKVVTDYSVQTVVGFCDKLNLDLISLKTDGGPAIVAPAGRVKLARHTSGKKATDLEEGSLKDSQSMGPIEGPIRWLQARARIFKLAIESKYGRAITANEIIRPWLVRHASWSTSTFRVCSDGETSHQVCFSVAYTGDLAVWGDSAVQGPGVAHAAGYSCGPAEQGREHHG